jgi:hypothetical protein
MENKTKKEYNIIGTVAKSERDKKSQHLFTKKSLKIPKRIYKTLHRNINIEHHP